MTRLPVALAPLLLWASVGTCAAQTAPRPDAPDAVRPFLPAPAPSVSQLVLEVQSNATLRGRYADFFHVPEAAVVPYMKLQLLPRTLRHPGSYTVYYVNATGTVYPARMALPPGTPVFVRRNGVPALLRGAGNPVAPFSMVTSKIVYAPVPPPSGPQEMIVPAGADIRVPASPR